MSTRWLFPRIEGVVIDPKTGQWSTSAFYNELLAADDQVPEEWHQAEPTADNTNAEDWKRWIDYLRSAADPRTVIDVLRLRAERHLHDLTRGAKRRASRAASLFHVPMNGPNDIVRHLGKREHWKPGRSAYELSHHWFGDGKIPSRVKQIWDRVAEYRDAEILWAAFEHSTRLDDLPGPSQTDLLLLVRLQSDERAVIAVEGKVDEKFDGLIAEKRSNTSKNSGWPARVKRLCTTLGIDEGNAEALRYQLLHRVAAAVIEAKRFNATHAMMLVHSFSEANPAFRDPPGDGFRDFERFAQSMKFRTVARNQITEARICDGVSLRLAWVTDGVSPVRS